MKSCYRAPIIINLGKCINETANVAKIVRKRFESIKNGKKKCMHLGHNTRKNNIYMMSECDEVLKNDFKWLINFNLKDIPIYDIDEEVPENKVFKRQRRFRRKEHKQNSVGKHRHIYSLSDVIQQCLFIKDQATIKEINKWISAAFPCFKSSDCTWKNCVRKTLLNNPIFKKKKLKLGKSDLWSLDENYFRDSSYNKEDLRESAESSVSENDSIKKRISRHFKEITTAIQIMQDIPSEENALNAANAVSISENSTQTHLSPAWIESRELQENHYTEVKDEDLIGCYKMPAEFQDEHGEPVEIHLLDENNMPILIDLI